MSEIAPKQSQGSQGLLKEHAPLELWDVFWLLVLLHLVVVPIDVLLVHCISVS